MKKILNIGFMATFLLLLSYSDASAQRRKDKNTENPQPTEQREDSQTPTPATTNPNKKTKKADDYFDESGGFKHRLWYGGNFNLGFSGSNGQSVFVIGVTPMVGYKIIGGLSAGPRFGVTYTSYKGFDSNNRAIALGLTEFSAGPFVRYKLFKNFFVQGEQEFLRSYQEDANGNILLGSDSKPIRQGRQNTYGGVGYTSGGGLIGYEISLMYNFTLPSPSFKQPFDIRFGFNYNF